MKIYGLRGLTHGGARVLTVMSGAGASAIVAGIDPGADLALHGGPGRLPQFHEKRAGGIARLVQAHGIEVLDKADWDRCKRELGDGVFD